MQTSRASTRRAALAAFLLFAAALLVVGPAEASRTTDARSSLASSSSLELASLELPMLEPVEPADSASISSRFGFAEDLGLLDRKARPCGFGLFGGVGTRRCALTYAGNNPVTLIDPDGRLAAPIAWIGRQLEKGARPVKAMALRTWAQVFGAAKRGEKSLIFPKGTPRRDIAGFAEGLQKRGAHVVKETDSTGPHFHVQFLNKEILESGEKSERFVRYGGKPSLHIYVDSALVAGMFVLDRWQAADAAAPEVVPDPADPRFTSYDYTWMWNALESRERGKGDDDARR